MQKNYITEPTNNQKYEILRNLNPRRLWNVILYNFLVD